MEKQFPEFSTVLFDMDGVIFDTEKVVVACWQEVAKKYGIPHIEEYMPKVPRTESGGDGAHFSGYLWGGFPVCGI